MIAAGGGDRIVGILAGDDLQDRRGIGHRPGHGAGDVLGEEKRNHSRPAGQPHGGPDPH